MRFRLQVLNLCWQWCTEKARKKSFDVGSRIRQDLALAMPMYVSD